VKNEEVVVSRREQRFHDFASYECNGQIVMSPQDFVESITENQPKSRLCSKSLRKKIN